MGQKMQQSYLKTFTDFSTGLDTEGNIFAEMENTLDPMYGLKSCVAAQNVKMDKDGLEKFKGFVEVLQSAIGASVEIDGLYEFKVRGAAPTSYFVGVANGNVYTISGGSATSVGSGLTAGESCNFLTVNDKCLIMNGVDDLWEFDGVTAAAVTITDPDTIYDGFKPKFAFKKGSRVYFLGDPSRPDEILSPQPLTYSNFNNSGSTVDAIVIAQGDGSDVTAAEVVTDELALIYKHDKVYKLTGSTPFGGVDPHNVNLAINDIGCIAPRTLVTLGKDHYFLSREGFRQLSTVFEYGDIRDKDPTYNITTKFNLLNYTENAIKDAFAVYVAKERHIYIHVPSGSSSQNDEVYVYDIVTGAIMPRTGIIAKCGAILNGEYYTGNYTGMIHQQLNGDNYAGDVIASNWESKWLPLAGFENKAIFKKFLTYFETQGTTTMNVQIQVMKMDGTIRTVSKNSGEVVDDVWDVGEWDVAQFDQGGSNIFKRNNNGRGRAIKFKIVNNNADERWKITRIGQRYINLGDVAT